MRRLITFLGSLAFSGIAVFGFAGGAKVAEASNCYFTYIGTTAVTGTCSSISWPFVAQVTWIRCWRRLADGTVVYDYNYGPKRGAGSLSTAYCDPYYVRSGQGINLASSW